LGRRRNGGIPGRAGQNVPTRPEIPVELGLDGVEQFRGMLVLVDQDRLSRLDETTRIGAYRRPRRGVIAVDHRPPKTFGQLTEQSALAHGPRPVQDQYRLFGEPRRRDTNETTLRQAGQNLSPDPRLPALFPDSGHFFPHLRIFSSLFPEPDFRKSGWLGRAFGVGHGVKIAIGSTATGRVKPKKRGFWP
jgi:hypothetical protein